MNNNQNENLIPPNVNTTSTDEGTTTETTETTETGTSTSPTNGLTTLSTSTSTEEEEDSFPSFTFSINNEEIKLPYIKPSKPRITPDVKEIEIGFSSDSYSSSRDKTSIIELENGEEFVMYSFRNEERDLMQQKSYLNNICIKTIKISKYRENYLHNYNTIRKLEVL